MDRLAGQVDDESKRKYGIQVQTRHAVNVCVCSMSTGTVVLGRKVYRLYSIALYSTSWCSTEVSIRLIDESYSIHYRLEREEEVDALGSFGIEHLGCAHG